jgi:hypothetical protein
LKHSLFFNAFDFLSKNLVQPGSYALKGASASMLVQAAQKMNFSE